MYVYEAFLNSNVLNTTKLTRQHGINFALNEACEATPGLTPCRNVGATVGVEKAPPLPRNSPLGRYRKFNELKKFTKIATNNNTGSHICRYDATLKKKIMKKTEVGSVIYIHLYVEISCFN